MKIRSRHWTVVAAMIAVLSLHAQSRDENKALLDQVAAEQQEEVNTIAQYQRDVRTNVFIAATHPELVVRLSAMQKKKPTQLLPTCFPPMARVSRKKYGT